MITPHHPSSRGLPDLAKDPAALGVSARVWSQSVGSMDGMANRAGRQKRPEGTGVSTLKTSINITDASWTLAERAAEALNISRDAYLDWLLAHEQLDESGRPVRWTRETAPDWWRDPNTQQELPLGKSA